MGSGPCQIGGLPALDRRCLTRAAADIDTALVIDSDGFTTFDAERLLNASETNAAIVIV